MSKQYLTAHAVDQAHGADIFSLAATSTELISASGSSTLRVHSTVDPNYPLVQSVEGAHRLGCHHVCTARGGAGKTAASVGFGGEIRIWTRNAASGAWEKAWEIDPKVSGEAWAVALSVDESYIAFTTSDGNIHVWDLAARKHFLTYTTGSGSSAGRFAMALDLSRDGSLTASGHENGGVYVFNNDTGKMAYSLSGLAKPVRAVAFSPGCKRLAAAGNAGIIALYDMQHGEHVGNLAPSSSNTSNNAWITSVDWSGSGEYLVSAALDGKVRVWDVGRGACVATHSETDEALWCVRWLPRPDRAAASGRTWGEVFCAAGASKSLTMYREATGA